MGLGQQSIQECYVGLGDFGRVNPIPARGAQQVGARLPRRDLRDLKSHLGEVTLFHREEATVETSIAREERAVEQDAVLPYPRDRVHAARLEVGEKPREAARSQQRAGG